jgi:cytochrome c biogenesis protein CcmG, thiol:disulfide interchange protein DsbE
MNGTNDPTSMDRSRDPVPDPGAAPESGAPGSSGPAAEGKAAVAEAETAPTDAGGEEERIITVGWKAIALPAVAILVAVAGFVLGAQALRNRGATPPSAAAPDAASPAAGPTGNPRIRTFEMGEVVGGAATINVAPPGAATSQASPQAPPLVAADQTAAPEGQVIEIPARGHPLLGKSAPDFTMTRVGSGEQVSLADFKGQPLLVNYWATWCPPCRLEMPWLQAAYDAHKDNGFVVLAVDAGEKVPPSMVPDTIQRFLDSAGLTFPVLMGDNTYAVQRQWSILGLPASFLIDREGNVVDFMSGAYPNQATLEHHLEAVLAPSTE